MKRPATVWLAVIVTSAIFAVVVTWLGVQRVQHDSRLAVLPVDSAASWIHPGEPTQLRIYNLGEYTTLFRVSFDVPEAPDQAPLTLRAMKQARVYLNGQLLLDPQRPREAWKIPLTIDLAPALRDGPNELVVEVANENGPRLVHAHAEALGLATGRHWEWSATGETWGHAVPAATILPSELSRQFPALPAAFLNILPWILPMFLVVFAWSLFPQRLPTLRAVHVRWAVIAAWLVLAVNNIGKINFQIGFDIEGHINYIHFITQHGRLPFPGEGWQSFQTPLYYVTALPFYVLFSKLWDLDTVIQALRFLTLACGVAQVEIAYRALRAVFPNRNDLQIAGTCLGGLIPINLYIAQYMGNEPLAGFLSAVVVLLCLHLLITPERASPAHGAILGAVMGLAVLAKISALLLLPLTALAGLHALSAQSRPQNDLLRRAAKSAAAFLIPFAAVTGWYFLRNYLETGRPFFGGWDPARGVVWAQDPGFRTLAQFLRFGEALVHPITAGTQGAWDALYSTLWLDGLISSVVEYEHRPPWNDHWMIAGAWLGIVPSWLMLIGAGSAWFRAKSSLRSALLFAAAAVAIYWAAFFYLFWSLPAYSTGKATYTLGILPCYALLGAAGLDILGRRRILRAVTHGALAVWAFAAYAAYFVW